MLLFYKLCIIYFKCKLKKVFPNLEVLKVHLKTLVLSEKYYAFKTACRPDHFLKIWYNVSIFNLQDYTQTRLLIMKITYFIVL